MTSKLNSVKSKTHKNGNRFYTLPGLPSIPLPSVTTLVGHFEPKWFLQKWKEDIGEEAARKIIQDSAALGTKVHKANECYFTGQPYDRLDKEEDVARRHELFKPFLKYVKPELIEEKVGWWSVYKEQHIGFGGTPDLVGLLQNTSGVFYVDKKFEKEFDLSAAGDILFVGDYKNWRTFNAPDRLLGKYLQLAAYSQATKQFTNECVCPRHGFLLGTTNTQLVIYYLDPAQMKWYWDWFLYMVKCYFLKEKMNWTEFQENSAGYMKNPEYGKNPDEKLWIKRPSNYLPKRLWLKEEKNIEFSESE